MFNGIAYTDCLNPMRPSTARKRMRSKSRNYGMLLAVSSTYTSLKSIRR